jgi:hypothetical protein
MLQKIRFFYKKYPKLSWTRSTSLSSFQRSNCICSIWKILHIYSSFSLNPSKSAFFHAWTLYIFANNSLLNLHFMKVSTENDNNFGNEKITIVVDCQVQDYIYWIISTENDHRHHHKFIKYEKRWRKEGKNMLGLPIKQNLCHFSANLDA